MADMNRKICSEDIPVGLVICPPVDIWGSHVLHPGLVSTLALRYATSNVLGSWRCALVCKLAYQRHVMYYLGENSAVQNGFANTHKLTYTMIELQVIVREVQFTVYLTAPHTSEFAKLPTYTPVDMSLPRPTLSGVRRINNERVNGSCKGMA